MFLKIKFLSFFLILLVLSVNCDQSSILCTKNYCDNYPDTNNLPCQEIPPTCNKSQSDSGIFLPSPTPCNCCDFCISYLKEGDSCTDGEKTTVSPTEMCGPGLSCDSLTKKCVPIKNTICTRAQIKYDEDKLNGNIGDYQIRPKCDDNGDYVQYHCIPGGICYCVDKNGKRIFGSIDNNGKAEYDLPCTCSRNYYEMVDIIGKEFEPNDYFRCKENGGYDTLQCIDDKTCICVDESDGTPTYDNAVAIEIWAISNETLPCLNTTEYTGSFLRRCEEIYINKTKDILDKIDTYDYVLAYELPKCTLDGYFAPVQEDEDTKYCSTRDGIPIEGYILNKTTSSQEFLDDMNCKCVTASLLMTSLEKPSCLPNGNYNPNQCRRGDCFTVDEDGNQIMP